MNKFISQLFSLEGKTAVVTGAGGYLCGEMARALAQAGCNVAVLDLRLEKAESVANEIKQLCDAKTLAVAIDVAVKEQHVAALKKITDTFGKVDILINGAGTNNPSPFLEIDLKDWYAVLDSQITGTFLGCQVFGEHMLANGSGSIINVSSASAGPPLSKAFTYSVAKAGIKNLTQNLGREWGTRGVRVNAIRPGFFPTDWNRKNFITKDREEDILRHTPMKRYGEVKELVGAIIWLASDASGFVTGSEVAVDGGFSCMTI